MSNKFFHNVRTLWNKYSTCTSYTCRFNITKSLYIFTSNFILILSFKTWDRSDQNCKRVTLQPTSPEYQNVLAQFHATMLGKYSQIIKIERIQNERWYKQVRSFHSEHQSLIYFIVCCTS
jgi:hypothetical protein